MSKICENCGNMIPDGADICPGCGRQQYDDALESILSELSFALDEIQSHTQEETPAQGAQPDFTAGLDLDDDLDLNLDLNLDEDLDLKLNGEPGIPVQTQQSSDDSKPVDPAIAAIGAQTQKKMGGKPGTIKTGASTSGTKKKSGKKKGKASNSGSSALAIIVGILIALLLVAGAAFFMLYRMGFFDLMNGDQLLASSNDQSQVVSTEESTQEPVEAEPDPMEETSSEEEEAPVEEEPQILVPEISVEETEEEEKLVQVDKFNLTGADDMTFTARGETAQIVYVIAPESAEPDIEWESSDDTIATVSASGVITARRGGDCTITGICGDKEVSVAVRCAFTVPTTVLDMNYSDITMDHEGQEVQLKIDYELTAAQTKATVWESSDPEVASVDDEGLVTAVGNGTVVVTASIGDYTASCIVRCVGVAGNEGVNSENSEYVINYEDVTLSRKGEYFQLSMKSILGGELPEYTWKSSDSSIATVDSKGVVTAVANGTCKITTTVGEDNFECIVRVHISG